MSQLPNIAARVLNKPMLLEPRYAQTFISALAPRIGVSQLDALGADAMQKTAGAYGRQASIGKAYFVKDGIAVIPVEGTLVHKSGYLGTTSGMMGYDGLAAQIKDAQSDMSIRGILLDVDSTGGEVSGVKALADLIRASAKPVWAHANETAASAAYWLASAASKVYLSDTAEVGSIGVVMAHTDASKAMDNEGYKVTLIHAGAHKVDGNPYEPLPDSVKSELQVELDQLRDLFAAQVAAGGRIKQAEALATEARMYRGQAAVDAGLANAVLSFDDTLALFIKTNAEPKTLGGKPRGQKMSNSQTTSPNPDGDGVTIEAHTAAIAQATTTAMQTGAASERARISAILGSESAKGREATAQTLALTTDMDAATAETVLASVPKQASGDVLSKMAHVTHVSPDAKEFLAAKPENAIFNAFMAKTGEAK